MQLSSVFGKAHCILLHRLARLDAVDGPRGGLGSIPMGVLLQCRSEAIRLTKGWDDGTPPLLSSPTSDSIMFVQCHLPDSSEFSATSSSSSFSSMATPGWHGGTCHGGQNSVRVV